MDQDDGKVVLIGNETDLLHCGYSHAIKDSGKRYPSAVHYTHSMILRQLAVDEGIVDELLCLPSSDVPDKARQLLLENMPQGHDLNTLGEYLQASKHSYIMQGLRLRVDQDQEFERALMDTKESLLIVCDPGDGDLGIGMDEKVFVDWMTREKVDSKMIGYWMRNKEAKPQELGHNFLGIYLMVLRYEVRQKKKASMLLRETRQVNGLSTDKEDKPVKISVNDLVISLEGIFRPLSNYYPFPFEMKGEKYRSVEHYAYEKLFNTLKLDDKMIEKIQTTVHPVDVPIACSRILRKLEIDFELLQDKLTKMDRWRQSAMKHKIIHNEYLQQLLMSTGDAILIDCAGGDPMWTCSSSEVELQRLLTKPYVTPEKLVEWMRGDSDKKTPKALQHLQGNKAGLLLMELRGKLATTTKSRIPLISPLDLNDISMMMSQNIICFTAESVWHPLYPAEIGDGSKQLLLPSPAHWVAKQAIKHLEINHEDSEYILESPSSVDCWYRLHEVIESSGRGLEREQSWWMEKRQKAIKEALQMLLEQHPPLLRALLDTGDALLVFCSRFTSIDAELSIGMRECDLRAWLWAVDVSAKQLLYLCARPMAFRPPYLGGNRLGIILMELRREFILRGVFPRSLPELQIGVETLLGTDSPTENMVVNEPFDILQGANYTSAWINPLYLLAKSSESAELMAHCTRLKIVPRLVTVDDEKIANLVEQIVARGKSPSQDLLTEVAPEDLRAVFVRYCMRLRAHKDELEMQLGEMHALASEVNRLQTIRRGLEETHRDAFPPQPTPLMATPISRIAAGKERFDYNDLEEQIDYPVKPKPRERGEYKIPNRKRHTSPANGDSRKRDRRDGQKPPNRRSKSPAKRKDERPTPTAKPAVQPKPEPKVAEPPKPPPQKPKRPPDAELSDGEILSTDEEDNK